MNKNRKTNLIVYVDAEVMDRPEVLFDIVYAHMTKKGVDPALRKQFMAKYMKIGRRSGDCMEVIEEWVQIRDVSTFPFRREDADKETDGGVSMDEDTEEQGTSPDGCDPGHGEDVEADSGQGD